MCRKAEMWPLEVQTQLTFTLVPCGFEPVLIREVITVRKSNLLVSFDF